MDYQQSMTNRQKMDLILQEIIGTYDMSLADFLWEYFRCLDSDGDVVDRSPLHAASLESLLQGRETRTFGQIIGEVLNDHISRPQDSEEEKQMFSTTQSYLTIKPALPAITTMTMELLRTRSPKYVQDPADIMLARRPSYMLSAPIHYKNYSLISRLRGVHLQRIFDHLTPPEDLLDPALHSGPRSLWCRSLRTWKSLTVMCRSWNPIATRYLYNDIVLRRVGQLPALIRTLQNKPSYHSFVNRLTFSFYVLDECDLSTNEGISYLLTRCSNLRSISFLPVFTAWLYEFRKDGVRRFEISDDAMRSATSITNLKISHPSHDDTGPRNPFASSRIFSSIPNITSLTLTMDRGRELSALPSCLLDLKEHHINQIRAHPETFQGLPFLDSIDPRLTSLRIDIGIWFRGERTKEGFRKLILNLIQQPPDLHIVLNDDWSSARNLLLSLPKDFVGLLDVWAPSLTADPTHERYANERKIHPEYNHPNVRFFDISLRNLLNLPFVCPPEDDIRTHHMLDMCFVSTPNHMFRREESWQELDENQMFSFLDSPAEDSSSNAENTPESDDQNLEMSEGDSDPDSDEEAEDEIIQLTMEQAVEMFDDGIY
ncbi:hypothetical protein QCA50_001488 [Cerrena zonata]|uniref:F-box domain-containing protein n=1 Tax=Cerrena zonata TaxID=2478898 RepID=A0AAW0GX95_9APHY